MGLVFVLGTIISMGLNLTMAQITGPLRNARFVIMALLANFVVDRYRDAPGVAGGGRAWPAQNGRVCQN
ncbi:hypothetical protein EO98_01210 [Methanosarcina sp. 2.H.T.1A.6]|nr:hypothetical protein EO94_19670 [Methanosarcina sp. 2.H.T.1A.3]KKG25126.1 hypothetical protein EO98_01210 [Methanosarcina sp. 2.H.T.1A.6]KKG27029.1 hypothetical protein EO96_11460 [Methanosarcina sp. 2.H.T.1A.8]KKG28845.1 hypothetical protein EO97_05315 [Methanosarcina sp. 2.H.T.1A.15]